MTKRRASNNEGIQADSVKADVMAVGKNAHAEQHNYSGSDTAAASLEALMEQLKQVLGEVPEDRNEDVEAVSVLAEDFVETSRQSKPNKKILEIKGESLEAAAKTLEKIAPSVLTIASQIVHHILMAQG